MSKDIVKSSAQFVYVNDPNRTIRAQIQVGTPLVGLPQWNTRLEVFVRDENGSSIGDLGFDPSRITDETFYHETPGDEWFIGSKLGVSHVDVLPTGFDGLKLSLVPPSDDGKVRIISMSGGSHVCTVWMPTRGNPDDAISSVYFSEFMISNNDAVRDIFIKYSYECDGISQHRHAVWGMLRLNPDPITMHQVVWFVNS